MCTVGGTARLYWAILNMYERHVGLHGTLSSPVSPYVGLVRKISVQCFFDMEPVRPAAPNLMERFG